MWTVEEQTVWHTSIPALSRSHTLHDAHAFCMREETRGGTCTPPQQQQMHSITTGYSYCTEHLRWLRYCAYCLGEVLDVGTDSHHVAEYPIGVKIPQITLRYTRNSTWTDVFVCFPTEMSKTLPPSPPWTEWPRPPCHKRRNSVNALRCKVATWLWRFCCFCSPMSRMLFT